MITTAPATNDPIELLHAATDHVLLVEVPERRVLAITGCGAPGGPAFGEALSALYGVAWTFVFRRRHAAAAFFRVGPLEGVWWMGLDEAVVPPVGGTLGDRESWRWRLMLELPSDASDHEVAAAIEAARMKARRPGLDRVEMLSLPTAVAAQILHVGPYDAELPTIRRLVEGIAALGYRPAGPHHEIYLGDPRRTDPARWRTILRYEVQPAPVPATA